MSNDLTQMTQRSLDEQVIGNLNRLQEQGLEMPPGYSPQNALKSAFFELTNNSGGNLLQLALTIQKLKHLFLTLCLIWSSKDYRQLKNNVISSNMEIKFSLCAHILEPWLY